MAESLKGTGVLIADDDESICACLGAILRRRKCCVFVAADGQAAVDLFRQHAANIEIAFLDVRMPRLDGISALNLLIGEKPSLRCCLMTAIAHQIRGRIRPDASELLEKPFDLEQFVVVFERLIAKRARSETIETAAPNRQSEGAICSYTENKAEPLRSFPLFKTTQGVYS